MRPCAAVLAIAGMLVFKAGSPLWAAEPTVPGEETGTDFHLIEHRLVLATSAGNNSPQSSRSPVSSRRVRTTANRMMSIPRARVLPFIKMAEDRHRLPSGLLDALIATESAYLPWQVSRAGAAGLAQLMPRTAVSLGVTDRFNPFQSIEGGARYLRQMLDRFGSVSLALAAYNAGPGAVARAGGIPLNGETPDYVSKVLRTWSRLVAP